MERLTVDGRRWTPTRALRPPCQSGNDSSLTPQVREVARVLLAGYNVDKSILDEVVGDRPDPPPLTPETLSAAYARISRDPRPVTELRVDSRLDVARARRSMNTIVFKYGHHSVAEHAAFNFDLLDVSRLAVESIESHRLASYTEKSQRYIKLGTDFVVPEEVSKAGLETPFTEYVHRCFNRYEVLLEGLLKGGVDESLAGEDARYVLPLATSAQLGMTVNGRTLEYMIRRLAAHPLAEARDLGHQLLEAGMSIAPSLLLFFEPGDYQVRRPADLAEAVDRLWPDREPPAARSGDVSLTFATPDGDARILAALALPALGGDLDSAMARVTSLDERGRQDLFEATTRHMTIHDPPPREFEHGILSFEVVLSSAAYGQLKRHRMSSQTPMPYDTAQGITVPPAIRKVGLGAELESAASDGADMAARLGGRGSPLAEYAMLNAHRRTVLMTLNLREMYHVSRLREDEHAQWDIRAVATDMSRLARKAFPVCSRLLGGKHELEETLGTGE